MPVWRLFHANVSVRMDKLFAKVSEMPPKRSTRSTKRAVNARKPAGKKSVKTSTNNAKAKPKRATGQAATSDPLAILKQNVPDFVFKQLTTSASTKEAASSARVDRSELRKRSNALNVPIDPNDEKLLEGISRINPEARVPLPVLPVDVRASLDALKPPTRRFHGSKFSLALFPFSSLVSPCADKFGYMASAAIREKTRLTLNAKTQALMNAVGTMMGDPGRETPGDSSIPSGFTYIGQFIDHDVTLDVSSPLDVGVDANKVLNMRTPVLDLDSLYGRGPVLDPFLYVFPAGGVNPTAIKFQLGTNQTAGPGGPAGPSGSSGGMQVKTDFDVPRMRNTLNPGASTNTAIIGDPRNDENLIVVQFHRAMLAFHNEVVDRLLLASFSGDIFIEAKRIVTHHYQWAVVHDFLGRVCGKVTVENALGNVVAPPGSPFRMPVEFAVAAYRFGHSMIRDNYWVNFNFPGASLGQVF